MEIVELLAIISVAIMCWLFCTFYFYGIIYEENEDTSAKISAFLVAILIGWIMTPIALGIKYGNL